MKRIALASATLLVLATSMALSAEGTANLSGAPEGDHGPGAVEEYFAKWWGDLGFPMDWEVRVALNAAYRRMPTELSGPATNALGGWRFVGPLAISSEAGYANQVGRSVASTISRTCRGPAAIGSPRPPAASGRSTTIPRTRNRSPIRSIRRSGWCAAPSRLTP